MPSSPCSAAVVTVWKTSPVPEGRSYRASAYTRPKRGHSAAAFPDIVQFASNIGGYQRVSTILAELVEVLDMAEMERVLPYTTTTAMQRLGYLLEFVLFEQDKADQLYDIVKKLNSYFNAVLMSSEHSVSDDAESNRWRVNMNIDIEIDEL